MVVVCVALVEVRELVVEELELEEVVELEPPLLTITVPVM